MPEWLVRIQGPKRDLRFLATAVRDPWRVTNKDGEFYLRSGRFENRDAKEVKRLADEFVQWAELHALARFEGYQGVVTGEIVGLGPGGSRSIVLFPATGHARGFGSAIGVGAPGQSRPPDLARDTALLRRRRFLAKAFRHVREEPNWLGYWKAAEALGDDIGGLKHVTARGWASQDQWKRFEETAHHNRHHRKPSPANPMSDAEGRSFILGLLRACLDWRLSQASGARS
jgi:hypothetical protein